MDFDIGLRHLPIDFGTFGQYIQCVNEVQFSVFIIAKCTDYCLDFMIHIEVGTCGVKRVVSRQAAGND